MTAANNKTQTIRSLDLGSGWAKLTRMVDGKLECFSFPSLAPRHSGRDLSGGSSVLGKRDTVAVMVEGTLYEVGPDAADLDTSDSTRNLNDQYIYTDQYRAVMYGALHYMGEKEIDLLVVGLPLTTINRAEDLRKLTIGTHKINETETVTIKDVLVLNQPMGGLIYCLTHAAQLPEFEFLSEETNLLIDPGYLTFDFLTVNGEKINDTRSGAHPGGVSKVLRAICDSISAKFGIQYSNLAAADKAIARRRIKISGKTEELGEHIRNAKAAIDGSVNFMGNIVGDGADIDNIILFGGGQAIFARTLANYFKDHTIYVLPNSQYINVLGFQAAGERHLKASPCPLADSALPVLTVLKYEAPPVAPAAPVLADI